MAEAGITKPVPVCSLPGVFCSGHAIGAVVLIRDNQQVVLKQIKNYLPKYQYINNGYVYIFNQRYQIVVRDLNQRKVAFHENKLFIFNK